MEIACSVCGAQPDSAATATLEWMRETDQHGRAGWVCPTCARQHVRSIEAKLDQEWW